MGNKKTVGIVLLVVGIILLIVSLTADYIGIGGTPGIGYKQILGAIAGAVVAVVGYVLMSRK